MVREADGIKNPDDELVADQASSEAERQNAGDVDLENAGHADPSDERGDDPDPLAGEASSADAEASSGDERLSDEAPDSENSHEDAPEDDVEEYADDFDALDNGDETDDVPADGPAVLPARFKRYSAPRHADATATVHDLGTSLSEKRVLGMSIRQLAMVAAISAAMSLVVSMAVSCASNGMMERSMDSRWRTYQEQMTEQIDEEMAQLSRMTSDYKQAAQEASNAQETNEAVETAKQSLQQAVSDARAWLESGDGQWVSEQTKATMNNALDVAQRLVEESGITDPQTYTDAAESLSGIIDGVAQGTLY